MVLVQTPLPKLFTINNKYKSVPRMFSAERRRPIDPLCGRWGVGVVRGREGSWRAGQLLPPTCTPAASPVLCQ